ncbi:TniQ family protein [Massilia sp. NR 4-1]|uniref:TniQ family protein n=1 Tax=Massilia sp. NR 4-1 TaxID=1678028 RepID=UPI00067CD645|nr:TniQ family protein [Massilia sp. NR 4-1]AKU23496.1 hypothetical protein ACZ75_20590 [Massilia sp. NR 4-1]
MSLIVTYPPRDDESGMGFYRRLSADNALFSWRNLTNTAGVERNRRALVTHSEDVARNLGLEPVWTETAKQKEDQCHTWGQLHRAHSDAVCPVCMAESTHLRHQWEHTYVTACPQHHIQLIDQCNACGNHLSLERLYIGLCSCGQDLSSLPHVPATPAQQWLSALIANDQRSVNIKPALHGVNISVLTKVIRTLCLYADPNQPGLPRRAALPKSVADAVEFLAPLDALLADWPMGFRSHVEQRIAAGRKNARTLNTLLGEWYISLRKLSQGTTLEPLLQIIIDVAAEKSDCVLGLDSAKAMAEDASGYMRARDAAKAFGVSISWLHDALKVGECKHRTRRIGTRGQVHEIPTAEVERIQQQRAEWISDLAACEFACVSPTVLDRMKTAGVILSDLRWREDLMKGGPVKRQSMQDLYEQVAQSAEPIAVAHDATLTWAELTSRRMGEKQAIESLMKAIAKGEVKAIARARTLGEMPFLRSDVSQYFGAPLLEAGMSIQQLATATGWKWESISHWIDEGLLESESIQRRGQPCRVVLPHQLLAFRQSYIPLADLARAMEKKASALSRSLPGIELVGAKKLPDGATRGGLIRIADLGRLAMLGARAGTDLFVPAP